MEHCVRESREQEDKGFLSVSERIISLVQEKGKKKIWVLADGLIFILVLYSVECIVYVAVINEMQP